MSCNYDAENMPRVFLPERPAPALRKVNGAHAFSGIQMLAFGRACAEAQRAACEEFHEAILSRATPMECLSELMRGLEIPPAAAADMQPHGFYAIGRAIAEQAKQAGKPSAPRVVTADALLNTCVGWVQAVAVNGSLAGAAVEDIRESFAIYLPAAIPPGYVVVPVEPTVDMQTAGAIAHSQAEESCRIELAQEDDIVFSQCPADSMRWRKNRAAYVYKSMLAAAPQAGERG